MKKIYVSIFIFLLLIGISSFSYCATTTIASQVDYSSTGLTVSVPNCDLDSVATWSKNYLESNNYELTNTPYCFAAVYEDTQVIVFFYNTYDIVQQGSGSDRGKKSIRFLDVRYAFFFNYSNQLFNAYLYDNSGYNSYTFGSVWYPYQEFATNQDIISNGEVLYSTQDYPLIVGGDNGGGNEDEEQDTGILDFIADFWSNLLHIVVPTDEQWQEVQDDWETDVLGKFNIQAWSYNENDYNYSNSWEWQDTEAPKIPITILGANTTIDMQSFNVWLNTPFSFGQKKLYYSSGGNEMVTTIDNGGLTIRKLINILLAIDLFILNIYLYNKFFSKED